ncbi:MAG: SurA N-terminal domain-containing protein [Ginsengibacter sp.]
MPIIQTIRDKGAAIVIGVIALSLIGFLLMDAKSGSAKLFGGNNNNTTIGTVNGESMEVDEFNQREKQMELQYPNTNGVVKYQIRQNVWDQMTSEKIINNEFKKLGLAFTGKEMAAIMFSEDAPQQLKQAFTNPETKQYDVEKAKQWWAETKKTKNEEQRNALTTEVINPMRLNSLYSKYTSMISASMYTPSWLITKEKDDNQAFSNISYVAVPYTDISDSTIKVSDDDINNYLQKNKSKYAQTESGRMISYVMFNGSASSSDSSKARQTLETLKPAFLADSNAKAFLARNVSAINYFDGYVLKSKMMMPSKDSLYNLPNGGVFGPYFDGNNLVLAKKLDTKEMPDSIKCRHILIATNNPQTQQQTRPDSVAKQKIDSIAAAIKNGADFNALEEKYSTDQAAHKDKGVMTFDLATIQGENFAKEFGSFLLNNKGETKKVVKTQFGYHYIEILEKKNPQTAYKIAYLAKEIVPSEETINAANSAATKMSGNARNTTEFNKYASDNHLTVVNSPNIVKQNDYQLGQLQDARALIKWSFEAKEGDVSEPFLVGNDYVVGTVTKKINAGIPDPAIARPMVESIIKNQKKAEQIKKKIGTPSSLEQVASAFQKQVLSAGADSTLTFSALMVNGIGNEPKVTGSAFNKDLINKISPAINGNTGVFVIKVNSIGMKAEMPPELMKQQLEAKRNQQAQTVLGQSFNSLKKLAEIKDNRNKFF